MTGQVDDRGWLGRHGPLTAGVVVVLLLAATLGVTAAVRARGDAEWTERVPAGLAGAADVAPHLPAGSTTVTKVLTIIVENHNLRQMQRQMPYLAWVADQYGYATGYTAIRHPSLPNYLAILGGSTFGVTGDGPPKVNPVSGHSVLGTAIDAGRTARTYVDEMHTSCQLTDDDTYAVRHNPWTYFTEERDLCRRFDVPVGSPRSGRLHHDAAAGALPDVGLLVPDTCNDAHDSGCTLGRADRWLHAYLPQLLDGPDFRSGRLAVVITADEDDRHLGNRVLTVVAEAGLHHVVVRRPLDHYSLSAFLSEVAGTAPLQQAARAPSFAEAFHLRLR